MMLLWGCPPQDTDDSDIEPLTCDTPIETDGEYSVLAADLPGGVLLSAYSDGDTAWMVGGELGGGPGVVYGYDGDTLCRAEDTERALWWVHGDSPGNYWFVGEQGYAVQVVDGVRTERSVPTEATLFGAFVTGDTVIAVGGVVSEQRGEVWRYAAGAWTALADDLPGLAFKVWEDLVVGDGIAYRIDTDALVPLDNDARLLTVRGDGSGTVWAVGGLSLPVVVSGAPDSWTDASTEGLFQPLNGVWTGPGEDVWVAGNFGTTARWDGDAWDVGPLLTDEVLHAVWPHCGEVLFVGGNLGATTEQHGTVIRYGNATDPVPVTDCPTP